MRRVLVKDYKTFFKEITKYGSLRKFSVKNKLNYGCMKRWARGENLIPEEIFHQLLNHSKNKDYWLNNIEYKQNNWGQKIGGVNAIKILSKKRII